jgi:hypothetical protein
LPGGHRPHQQVPARGRVHCLLLPVSARRLTRTSSRAPLGANIRQHVLPSPSRVAPKSRNTMNSVKPCLGGHRRLPRRPAERGRKDEFDLTFVLPSLCLAFRAPPPRVRPPARQLTAGCL